MEAMWAASIVFSIALIPALWMFAVGMNGGDRKQVVLGAGLYCGGLPVALGFPIGVFGEVWKEDGWFSATPTALGWTSLVLGVVMGAEGLFLLARQAISVTRAAET